jgi:mannitol/fructose-specific phosphotransferase system IIA component
MLFGKKKEVPSVLEKDNIIVDLPTEGHEDAIRRVGNMLVKSGYVTEPYIEGMIARDRGFSTAIGNSIAIPHGENDYKEYILNTGIVVCTYPDGIEWDGGIVKLVIGIAAKGDEHLEILGRIVEAFEDEEEVNSVVASKDVDKILDILLPKG